MIDNSISVSQMQHMQEGSLHASFSHHHLSMRVFLSLSLSPCWTLTAALSHLNICTSLLLSNQLWNIILYFST